MILCSSMAVPGRVYAFLVIGLIAVSQSGNIIRLGDANPVAIAAWRLLIATVLLSPLAAGQFTQIKKLPRTDMILLLLAGISLAGHFFAWIYAVQLTTVAHAAIFLSINPVITATAGYLIFKEKVTSKLFISILLGIAGVACTGIRDLDLASTHFAGNMMALVCSIIFSVYFLLGKRLRRTLSNQIYVTSVYGTAAVFSFVCMLFMDLPLVEYSAQTWLCFVLMALIPTMAGHTALNNSLKYIDAGRISAATLSEPLLAGLVAWLAWNESVTSFTVIGYVLICASVIVLVLDMPAKKI